MKDPNKPNDSFLNKEVDIKFKPITVLHKSIFVLLLVVVFFLGRWSVDTSTLTSSATVIDSDETAELAAPAETEDVETKEDSDSFMTGFVTAVKGWFTGEEEPETTVENTTAASNTTTTETTEDTTETATETTETEETVEETLSEPIITTYSKVALAISAVKIDWKDTWGKITQIDYTIKNNEAGTVKPSYLIMTMEGYDDYEKKINLPSTTQSMVAGKTVTEGVFVPKGFSYSQQTTGDLNSVTISFILYDANDKPMASFSKDFNLQGS